MLARNRQFGAERVDRVEIETEHRLARAAERGAQRIGGDEGVAVAIAADPASRLEEVRAALAERTVPALVERGQRGQKHVAQIGERGLDLVGDVELFAPDRTSTRLNSSH